MDNICVVHHTEKYVEEVGTRSGYDDHLLLGSMVGFEINGQSYDVWR